MLCLLISGPSVEVVKPMIESTASSAVDYMAANRMALNPERTQILWVGSGAKSPMVMVACSQVSPVVTVVTKNHKQDAAYAHNILTVF